MYVIKLVKKCSANFHQSDLTQKMGEVLIHKKIEKSRPT